MYGTIKRAVKRMFRRQASPGCLCVPFILHELFIKASDIFPISPSVDVFSRGLTPCTHFRIFFPQSIGVPFNQHGPLSNLRGGHSWTLEDSLTQLELAETFGPMNNLNCSVYISSSLHKSRWKLNDAKGSRIFSGILSEPDRR